jgi:hypothetical protein
VWDYQNFNEFPFLWELALLLSIRDNTLGKKKIKKKESENNYNLKKNVIWITSIFYIYI